MHHGCVYVEVQKGIYGLKEADILAYTALIKHLEPYGFYPVRYTPGLWRHKTSNILLTLAVDNFGIKCYNKCQVDHLFKALRTKYEISVDWTGCNYCGLTIQWQDDKEYVDIYMPGYVQAVLQSFQHPVPATL